MDLSQLEVAEDFPIQIQTEDESYFPGHLLLLKDDSLRLIYYGGSGVAMGFKKPESIRKALDGTLENKRGETRVALMTFDVAMKMHEKGIRRLLWPDAANGSANMVDPSSTSPKVSSTEPSAESVVEKSEPASTVDA